MSGTKKKSQTNENTANTVSNIPSLDDLPTKKKGGRQPLDLDEEVILKLARIGCTAAEIGDWFRCSRDVIERRYADLVREGHSEVKMSIRRQQLILAEQGNVAMLIWLGKQFLGQREPKKEISVESTQNGEQINVEDARRTAQMILDITTKSSPGKDG